MAINAELFDGTILEFPEGTDPSVIQATARRITLERQAAQGGEPRRNDLGEIQPRGSMAYEAISKVADVARPYVEPVTDYVGEQASLLSGAAQKGYANLKTSAKQSQVAGLMELQEARKATYGTFENMPPKEQENYIKAQKAIEEKLGEVAGLGVEKQNIDKEYGVRASSKAFNEISNLKEYKEGSFFDKMGLIGSGLAKDPIGIITDLGVESLPQSLAVAATAVAARTGQLNPKIAAGLGGSSSAMMEFGNVYAELRGQGMDHIEAWEKAGVKSGIVGLFDAASFYSAGKAAGDIVNNIQKGAVKETVKTVTKETGKQGALGAAGEGVGSATIGQEVDPLELTKEAIGEIFGAPGDAIGTYQSKVAEARAAGKPDPAPPVDVKKMMSDKGFSFKPRTTIEQDLQGMDVIYPEDAQAAAPSDVIEIKGVGRNPDEVAPSTEEELIGDIEASQDRRAMLAELEDEQDQERELKQVTVQPEEKIVEPVKAEEKAPEFAKAVNVKDFNPEDKAAIRAMEVDRNKIKKEKKLFPGFLRKQGVQPSEKADLGLEGISAPNIWKVAAPSFDELTSRAISEGFLMPTGDDVQDVENMRQHVKDYIGSGIITTGPDLAREGQLRAIDDSIQEIVRKYEQPAIELKGQTPDEARAQAAAIEKQQADEQRAKLEQQRAEKAERDRAEIKQRSTAAADDFQLGQTAEDNLTGQKDVFAEPEERSEYKPPKLRTDNPGGDWLKNKREQSIEDGKKNSGVPIRFGSVTGTFKEGNKFRKPLVPVEVLARLQGMNDEQNNVRPKDLEAIKKIMDETGRLPKSRDGEDYVPFINVYQDGTAYVNEGNHRIMAAKALGFKYLPIEISYFNGSEEVEDGDLSPKMVISYDMQARDDKITLDNYRGEKKDSEREALPMTEQQKRQSEDMAAYKSRNDRIKEIEEMPSTPLEDVEKGFDSDDYQVAKENYDEVNKEYSAAIKEYIRTGENKATFTKTKEKYEAAKKKLNKAIVDGRVDEDPDADIPFNIERKQTSTPAFKKWFGNSKVVDDNGKPLVVYHGTDKADFSIFDPASWFTDNAKEASAYAQTDLLRKRERLLGKYKLSDDTSAVGKTVPFASVLSDIGDLKVGEYYAEGGFDGPVYKYLGKNKYEVLKNVVVDLDTANLNDMTIKLKKGQSKEAVDQVNETKEYADTFEGGESGRVYPSYLSIKNPLYLDAFQVNNFSQRLGKSKEEIQAQVDKWKSQGYDGIITDSDEARFFPEVREEFEGIPKQYIPFDSTQIKSATGNIGTFDEGNPDVARNITLKRSKFTEKFLLPAEYVQDDTRAPSLRVNLKRLVRQFKNGTMAPETFSMRVENAIDETKPKGKTTPRVRGPDIIREKLLAAKRRGELTEEAVDLAEWFISRNPALFENLGISIKQPKEGSSTAGYYNPMERVFTLMKYSNNDETAVHEMLHHMERMMPDNVQDGIRKSWFTSLAKAAKEAQKGTDKNLQDYYTALIDYHTTGSRESLKTVKQLLDNGDVGYDHYQHYNASEFFAVNAADIVAGRYAQSKSIVGKLKQWLKELGQKLKALFRLQSSASILRALDSLAKSDGKYVSTVMISDTTDFMDRKNYKGGKAPLSAWADPQESKIDNILYKVQDKLIDTKRVQQAIEQQVGEIEDNWNAYMKEELYHGRTAKRTQDFLKNELSPIVKELSKANIDIGEFDQFLHNRHAEERNVQIAKINPAMPDAGSGIATADAQQYMKDLDPTKRKLLEKLADKIDSMVKGTQRILIDSGLEEQSTIDVWNKTYKHYVPLKREDVDFVHTGTGLGQGFATRGGTSARATGSLKNVAEIFGNLALQRERAIIRAEKARVGKAMYGLAIKNPNPDFWLPVNPDAIKNKAKLEQELVNMGLDPIDAKNLIQEPRQQYIDPRTGLVAYRVNPVLRSSDNVFPVRINGQDRFIFFNSSNERAMRMVSAIKNLDADQLGIVMNVTSNVTRWLASVNTQYNPVFGAINFFRDVQGAALNLSTTPLANKKKEVLAGTLPALRGIYQDLRDGKGGMWADLFEDYQLAGGQTGYRDQFSRNRRQASIVEREMGAMKRGNVKKAAYAVAQWLSDYNDAMENAVRLSAYKTALDMGLSKEKAASIAKNLTVNFNRKGTYAQTVGALYAFFNASVQGTARLAETMKGPAGRKIFYGGLALGSLQAVALLAAGFDDDEPPEFIKSRNLIIPTGGKTYIAIPMPLGFNMFPNLGRLTTEFVLSGGKNPAKKTLDIVSMVFNTFNPIGGSGLQLVSPTIVDPIAALYTNVDAFGRPISKEDRKTSPTPGYTRSREQASTVSKYIAEFLNYASGGTKYQKGAVSPTADQLDYLVGQATGGVGRETAKAVGAVKSVVTGEELPSYKVPIAGKFYGNTESPANIASKFYDNVTQLANYENEIKGRQKNRENVGQFLREHPEARLYQRANQLENQISQINKDKKALIERKAPQKQIDVLDKRKTMMMDKFNKDYKKASK